MWWMGLAFALIGTAMILVGFFQWKFEKDFREHAVPAVAHVTGKVRELQKTGNKSQTVHLLLYTYQDAEGRQYEGKAGASAAAWSQAKTGDTLTIEYASNNPTSSRRAGNPLSAGPALLVLGGIGGLFTALGLPLMAYSLVGSSRRARLVRNGVVALGVVGDVMEDDSALKVAGSYRLTYRFTDEQGATREGRGPAQPWSLAARWDPGETILVLYDPRHPDRNEADIFEARQDDFNRLLDAADTR